MIPGTVARLLQTAKHAEVVVLVTEDNSSEQYTSDFTMKGSEITKQLNQRARNVLVEVANRVMADETNDRVALEAVKMLLSLRAEIKP